MARKGLNIYKRKDGRWEARYIKSRNTQGKPRYGYLYATSYHKVRNNLQKVIQALNATDNEKVPATNYKFMGFSAIWLENSSTSLKESTYIRYRTLLNCYLMPSFQQLEISEITSERVCTFCKELEKHGKKDGTGLSPKTISDILSVLRRILYYAQDQNISIDVTAFNIRVKQTPKVMGILSLSEQTTLQEYLVNQLDSLNLGILICLYTGIRVGELCALTWEKISFSDKTICICQTMQRIQKRTSENKKTHIIIAAPKSSSANRVIPIPNTLLKILSQYPMEKTGYFLSGSLSEVVEPRRIQYRFHKILKECGIDRKNFHVLRHTFATRCVEANIDIKTLSEILGHSSVSITMNRYVHPSLSLKRDSMEKLADFIAVK
ncbi:tyrosine-type recombinase/integrase [Faecalibacterium prausnitzii]|jgi:integrase|uniref:tyrosine-type recombinase/integrase n=1 Tax=Faecalibacterium prausnitzii TaxID=853 RepID=UPI0032AFBC7C